MNVAVGGVSDFFPDGVVSEVVRVCVCVWDYSVVLS